MKTPVYIIPGLGETCRELRYRKLAAAIQAKGYKVVRMQPNWYKPLLTQIIAVPPEAIIIGFSIGAVIAYFIGLKTPCQKLVLASLSPINRFTYWSLYRDLCKYMSKAKADAIASDLTSLRINLKKLKIPYVTLAGALEKDLPAEFLVPKTSHIITKEYITCITKLL